MHMYIIYTLLSCTNVLGVGIILYITLALNARKRLMAIREAIPSVNAALTKLNENLENHKLSEFTW